MDLHQDIPKFHRIYQFQWEKVILSITWCIFHWIIFTRWKIYCTDSKRSGRVEKRRKNYRQKYLSISYLQTDYLILDNSSGSGRNKDIENIVQENALFVNVITTQQRNILKKIRKDKGKDRATGDLDKQ